MSGIAICGMSGAGKTSTAKALANELGLRFLDIEDYYFPPAEPPYSVQRDKEEISRLLRRDALSGGFVFASVSPDGYGIDDLISAVFWLNVPKDVRISRIRNRHRSRFGKRVLPGGDMFDNCEAFVKMCESRDEVERKTRARLPEKPFMELDGGKTISENVKIIIDYITESSKLSV